MATLFQTTTAAAVTIVGKQTIIDQDQPAEMTLVLTPGAELEYVAMVGLMQRQKRVIFQLQDGARLQVATLVWGRGTDHLQVDYTIAHQGKATTAMTLVKGVLDDSARADISGLIKIAREGNLTESFLEQRALLVSDGARANLTPQLEIEANDVRASHAATVGQLDETQMFYCQSRGLPRPAAKALMVQAFVGEILVRFPAAVRTAITAQLADFRFAPHFNVSGAKH